MEPEEFDLFLEQHWAPDSAQKSLMICMICDNALIHVSYLLSTCYVLYALQFKIFGGFRRLIV